MRSLLEASLKWRPYSHQLEHATLPKKPINYSRAALGSQWNATESCHGSFLSSRRASSGSKLPKSCILLLCETLAVPGMRVWNLLLPKIHPHLAWHKLRRRAFILFH